MSAENIQPGDLFLMGKPSLLGLIVVPDNSLVDRAAQGHGVHLRADKLSLLVIGKTGSYSHGSFFLSNQPLKIGATPREYWKFLGNINSEELANSIVSSMSSGG